MKVKRLIIYPGQMTSYQYHNHRAELWNVIEGVGTAIYDNSLYTLNPHESLYIHQGVKHQIQNKGTSRLVIIEIQLGELCSEADIVRLRDPYNRG